MFVVGGGMSRRKPKPRITNVLKSGAAIFINVPPFGEGCNPTLNPEFLPRACGALQYVRADSKYMCLLPCNLLME